MLHAKRKRGNRKATATCKTSLTKATRRSKLEISRLEYELFKILEADNPQTVRQVYYRAVCLALIGKTENEYKNTVCRLLGRMRCRGDLPFAWIADNTRWMRKPTSYRSLRSALVDTQEWYRRDLWSEQDAYVEVWTEKDALAGVLLEVTGEWDVPLMVSRGFTSMSFLHSAAEKIASENKPTFLYYFGDFDPSGVIVSRKIEEGIRKYAPEADVTFVRVAVNEEQIEEMDLPTRPTKRKDNSHAKKFESDVSVEVDAIPGVTLRKMCRECVVQHIDDDRLEALRLVESEERETLLRIVEQFGEAG